MNKTAVFGLPERETPHGKESGQGRGKRNAEKAAWISTFQEAAGASHQCSPITAEILSPSISARRWKPSRCTEPETVWKVPFAGEIDGKAFKVGLRPVIRSNAS
jgi:hypothetical protein